MTISSWLKVSLPVALVLLSATGVASAAPGDGPLIATTCTYQQLNSALQVQAPDLAAKLANNPQAQSRITELLALPVDQRKQRLQDFLNRNPDVKTALDQKWGTPAGQDKQALAATVANTCHNY